MPEGCFFTPPTDSQLADKQLDTKNLSGTFIPVSQVPLFADLSEYNLIQHHPATRAGESSSDDEISLESLLDREATKIVPFEDQVFVMTPFLQNNELIYASIGDDNLADIHFATVVKKYYVEMSVGDYRFHYVVTMITDFDYYKQHPDFDVLHKPNFSGAEFISSVTGELVRTTLCFDGLIKEARILKAEEIAQGNAEDVYFINLFKSIPATKARTAVSSIELTVGVTTNSDLDWMEGGMLDPAYCESNYAEWCNDYWNSLMVWSDEVASAGSSLSGSSDLHLESHFSVSLGYFPEYYINISSNCDEMVPFGNGRYPEGSSVTVGFSWEGNPHLMIVPPIFTRWVGDLENYKSETVSFIATTGITSTAYFDDISPCRDKTNNITNPLRSMVIAATKNQTAGGLFNASRNGGRKHKGLDLLAEPGTSMYAMYSGVVHDLKTNSPDKYVDWSYGNEIVIKSIIDGETLFFMYSHLNYGTPIAINPRTREPFKEGDIVYAGDLIGYTGKTGNAYYDDDVPNKHLHLGVSTDWHKGNHKKNNWIDPAPYINGSISSNTYSDNKGIIRGRIVSTIHCD